MANFLPSGRINSNLSNPKYLYDVVCAVNMNSLNAAVKLYYITAERSGSLKPVKSIYVADTKHDNTPMAVDYDGFVKDVGVDPFAIPGTADPNDPNGPYYTDFEKLYVTGKFMFAWSAMPGVPPVPDKASIEILQLTKDNNNVWFNSYCSEFQIAQLTPATYGSKSLWYNQSQPSEAPWFLQSTLSLMLEKISPDSPAMPPKVKAAIEKFAPLDNFDIQQLLFSLESLSVKSGLDVIGMPAQVQWYVQQAFSKDYMTAVLAGPQPLQLWINATAKKTPDVPADFRPTSQQRMFQLYQGHDIAATGQLTTLNYLCMTQDRAPLPKVNFDWNWQNASSAKDYSGVMAINRSILVKWICDHLTPVVNANCFDFSVNVKPGIVRPSFSCDFNPNGQAAISQPSTGPVVLNFSYGVEDRSDDDAGEIIMKPWYVCDVTFSGSSISIHQHLGVYLYLQANTKVPFPPFTISSSTNGNIIDWERTDAYDLAVDEYGSLVVNIKPGTTIDRSKQPSQNWIQNFFTGLTNVNDKIIEDAKFHANDFGTFPAACLGNIMFPGGRTFAFADPQFSGFQDLTVNLTYAAP